MFGPATVVSSGKYANHYTTKATLASDPDRVQVFCSLPAFYVMTNTESIFRNFVILYFKLWTVFKRIILYCKNFVSTLSLVKDTQIRTYVYA
jgi:hypothetical protein